MSVDLILFAVVIVALVAAGVVHLMGRKYTRDSDESQ